MGRFSPVSGTAHQLNIAHAAGRDGDVRLMRHSSQLNAVKYRLFLLWHPDHNLFRTISWEVYRCHNDVELAHHLHNSVAKFPKRSVDELERLDTLALKPYSQRHPDLRLFLSSVIRSCLFAVLVIKQYCMSNTDYSYYPY